VIAVAYISPQAPQAAADLEATAIDLHGYMHTVFPSSYGSHDMEEAADALHDELLNWSANLASEADVVMANKVANAALDDMGLQFVNNGVFLDPVATVKFYDVFADKRFVDRHLRFADKFGIGWAQGSNRTSLTGGL
jgi:hypothetical protein